MANKNVPSRTYLDSTNKRVLGLTIILYFVFLVSDQLVSQQDKSVTLVCGMSMLFLGLCWLRRNQSIESGKSGQLKRLTKSQYLQVGLYVGIAFLLEAAVSLVAIFTGSKSYSSNTNQILKMIQAQPEIVLYVSLVAPFIEELVFRQSVFGLILNGLNKLFQRETKATVIIAALLTGIAFSAAHGDSVIGIYVLMSLFLQWIYWKQKDVRINMMVHASINIISLITLLLN